MLYVMIAPSQLLGVLEDVSFSFCVYCCCLGLQVEPELRGPVGDALAAYSSISDKQLLSNLYRVTLQKYQKVKARPEPCNSDSKQ
jgi:hypothetical protein